MLPVWDASCERRAKEVLYRCLEELGSTKACLYLLGSDGSYELAAQYGFGRRDPVLAEVNATHPLWDWIRRNRTAPAFLNSLEKNSPLAGVLKEAGTARILTIPLAVGGRLVGFIDVRDKARRAPFTPEDLPVARAIGAALEAMIRELGLFGPAMAPGAPATAEQVEPPASKSTTRLHESFVADVGRMVRQCAGLPGVAAAALTVGNEASARVLLLRTVPLDAHQREALASHQAQHLEGLGVTTPAAGTWVWTEEESGGSEKQAHEISTSLLFTPPPVWVLLSVVARGDTSLAATVHSVVARHAKLSLTAQAYRRASRNLARTLLEPGEQGLPALRQHSQSVSELAQRMAHDLGFDDEAEELVTVAGYLHDVGMRELEYARIYRAAQIGEVEKRLFRRHPLVGARIVEGCEFPGDLAAAIRHHHERWDGEGYPNRLSGMAIPPASRILHLAEVYDVLTSPESYRQPVGREAALRIIRDGAGTQFDPELVPVLERAVAP
jgi:putative nucleotidyltransferase with HDIG domain